MCEEIQDLVEGPIPPLERPQNKCLVLSILHLLLGVMNEANVVLFTSESFWGMNNTLSSRKRWKEGPLPGRADGFHCAFGELD
jgi:hypothetical protein